MKTEILNTNKQELNFAYISAGMAGTLLCSSLFEVCVQNLKSIVEAIFILDLVKCLPL